MTEYKDCVHTGYYALECAHLLVGHDVGMHVTAGEYHQGYMAVP